MLDWCMRLRPHSLCSKPHHPLPSVLYDPAYKNPMSGIWLHTPINHLVFLYYLIPILIFIVSPDKPFLTIPPNIIEGEMAEFGCGVSFGATYWDAIDEPNADPSHFPKLAAFLNGEWLGEHQGTPEEVIGITPGRSWYTFNAVSL